LPFLLPDEPNSAEIQSRAGDGKSQEQKLGEKEADAVQHASLVMCFWESRWNGLTRADRGRMLEAMLQKILISIEETAL
jgi:hypothetical protein